MALNPLGVLDLSIVTDRLIKMIGDCIDNSPLWGTLGSNVPTFTITVSGSMPESVRKDGGCQLTVSLIHIAQDKFQRNFVAMPPAQPAPPPQRAQTIPFQPLSLDLYYLITAFADKSYVEEQQAMSIVLRCFHENPIVRTNVVIPVPPPQTVPEEFTLTMEIETSDELSRMWQAMTAPFRLSAVYKVSVVFITPPAPAPTAKQATRFTFVADPTAFPYAQGGQVIGTSSSVTFAAPASTPANPEIVNLDYSPATVVPSQRFILYGAGLKQPTSTQVYLLLPDPASPSGFTEHDVTANWKAPNPDPQHPLQTDARITLDLPATVGALPANSPPPGVYQLRVGNNLPLGDPNAVRSNATPFSIAAQVDVTTPRPNPPILTPVGGTYTIQGMGFTAGKTEVLLDTIALVESPPGPGHFTVNAPPGTTITFQTPSNIAPGLYTVRIRVNQVESPPGWWIRI